MVDLQVIEALDGIPSRAHAGAGPMAELSTLGVVVGFLDAALRAWDDDRFQAKSKIKVAATMLRDYAGDGPRASQAPASSMGDCGGLAPWQARKVKEFIDASLDVRIRLGDCAGKAGLSNSYFSHAFKVTFGVTVCDYIRQRRVERAKYLMLQSNQPLSQIALACGFGDQAHYCRVFRDVAGVSPNKWRRNNMR